MAKDHGHHEAPLRTTPQGLAAIVTDGHELTDANLASVGKWSLVLAATVAFSFIGVWGGLVVWGERQAPPSGTALSMQQLAPPEPRLLPNPSLPYMIDPKDALVTFREEEEAKLRKVGLLSGGAAGHASGEEHEGAAHGGEGGHAAAESRPTIPHEVLEKVASEGTPSGTDGLHFSMPSDHSGGTGLENRHR